MRNWTHPAWLAALLFAAATVALPISEGRAQNSSEPALDRATPRSYERLAALEERVVETVEQVRPAVVGLRVGGAGGSGTLISEDGYIATAAHVIGNPRGPHRSRSCQVFLADGSAYRGRTLGMNHHADYGLVKFDVDEGTTVPFVECGDTSRCTLGQWVVAMGHPLGTETPDSGAFREFRPPVVRIGRIHFKRQIPQAWHIVVDAPLISGDSGGPMFDLDGKLIAINVSIDIRQTWVNNGTWITPFVANLERLKNGELIEGVGLDPEGSGSVVTPQQIQALNAQGVEHLQSGDWEAAERAFQQLLEIDPSMITAHYNLACTYSLWSADSPEPQAARLRTQAIDALRASIDHGWSDTEHMAADRDLDPIRNDFAYDALVRRILGHEPYVGLTPRETEQGVVIASVGDNTAAATYGLEVGDVIRQFGPREIASRQDLIDAARQMRPADRVPVRVERAGRVIGLTLIMGGRERERASTISDEPRRDSMLLRHLLRDRGQQVARSVVTVLAHDQRRAFGVVVHDSGLILVKNDEIARHLDSLVVRLPGGQEVAASRVAVHPNYDVALLRVSTTDLMQRLQPIEFADEDPTRLGSLLFSVGVDAVPFAVGVRSLQRYRTQAGAFLGIQLEEAGRWATESLGLEGAVSVTAVVPDTGAARAGVREADLIYRVDDVDVRTATDLQRYLGTKAPGDTLDVHLYRQGEALTLRVTLGARPSQAMPANPMLNQIRGRHNARAAGFGEVVQHDGVVLPDQTGSPIIDLDGRVIGLNIARSDRTKTYALPAAVIREALPGLFRQAKLYETERSEDF